VKVKYLAHSSFLLTASDGTRIVTDPYKPGAFGGAIKYGPITETADYATVSHDHLDHNNVAELPGKPVAIGPSQEPRAEGQEAEPRIRAKAGGVMIAGFDSFHDAEQGAQRGRNIIFVFEDAGLRVAHLGDLGHLPKEQAKAIGRVDVAFIPVGGYFTIDPTEAAETAELLGARVVIPMHFATGSTNMPIVGVEEFTKGRANVKQLGGCEVEVTAGTLPKSQEVWVLKHSL
jgi:L-ascorbate metabolism protein UlaG (beta-lactamase superfamily)